MSLEEHHQQYRPVEQGIFESKNQRLAFGRERKFFKP
jgi:hypothetical protein